MSSLNKSASYGYYGGKAPGEIYFPPSVPEKRNLPISKPFTKQQLQTLLDLASFEDFKNFLQNNAESILVRTLSAGANGYKTFIIENLENINESITYTTNLSSITLLLEPTPTPTMTNPGPPPTPEPTETLSVTPTITNPGPPPTPEPI